jgi:adenine-specific DNA-methyltransferase
MNFIKNESPTKLRGGYYTPPDIALFLTKWVFESNPRLILEPSCGDGIFLDAISQLNQGNVSRVLAVEKDSEEACKALQRAIGLRQLKTQIISEDFLEWGLLNVSKPLDFDAVLGNPPFIRYQYLDGAQQSLMEKVFKLFHLPFTKHTNAWVPFIILSIAHLKAGGRLAMVVPSEILHVLHAQQLRTFLASHCSKIHVIDPEELWFGDTLQGVVLLLAEKNGPERSNEHGVAITQVRDRLFLEDPSNIFNQANYLNGDVIKGKWMLGLLSQQQRELLIDIIHRPNVTRFKQIASVDVGIVTGANKFFLVPDEVVDKYKLGEWAHPMFGRSEHAPGVIYDAKTHRSNKGVGFPTNFLWFQETDITKYPKRIREYLKKGEEEGLHKRFKCRVRSPWFKVPSVYTTPVGMLKRCHDYPRLISNKANAYTTDTAYRIRTNEIEPDRLVYSFINSLTSLSAELEGRHYGGGVLELVPSEIERLVIPTPEVPVHIDELDKLIRTGVHPEKLFTQQNKLILGGIGISKAEQETLLEAWNHLRSRRQRSQSKEKLAAATVSL